MKKKIIFLISVSYAIAFADNQTQTVRLTAESTVRIQATCKSDEFAFVDTRSEKEGSESTYVASVKCTPAICVGINYGGNISVYRATKIPRAVGVSAYRQIESLASGIKGDKKTALAEANKFLTQGLCKNVEYAYTNNLREALNKF